MQAAVPISIEAAQKTISHPCYNCGASANARMHLPVAPKCNIQCNYCVRKFDCVNETRPGVVSTVLTPEEAVDKYALVKEKLPNLTVVGIAGPGDALANFSEVREALQGIRRQDPDVTFCLSTNGLLLPQYVQELDELKVTHVTVTLNTLRPETGAKIYKHVNYRGETYTGQEGAALLLKNQLQGIEELVHKGIVVKINIVLLPGINEDEILEIVQKVSELGCMISNIMKFIPVQGSAFEKLEPLSGSRLHEIRKAAEQWLPQMYHCKQCRADAIGRLDQDVAADFCGSKKKRNQRISRRFAVCTKDGVLVDQHFGHCTAFYIYDYDETGEGAVLVEKREVEKYCNGPGEAHGRKLSKLLEMLSDCEGVLAMRIGAHVEDRMKEAGLTVYKTYAPIAAALQEAEKTVGQGVCAHGA
ncbi:MAG: nitrogenase cofactor biosynthesis protein NifB [Lachnospiraceae bacterium]